MKRYDLYIFFILFISFNLDGQKPPNDIKDKITYTIDLLKNNEKKGLEYYHYLDSLLKENNDLDNWLILNREIGYFYDDPNKPFQSINWIKKTIDNIWREPKSKSEWKSLAWLNADIGYIYKSSIGNYKNALQYYENCRKIFEENVKTDSLKYSKYYYPTIGNIYTRLGEYEKAIYYLTKYKNLAKKANEYEEFARALNDIAIIYQSTNKDKKAIKVLHKSQNILGLSDEIKIKIFVNYSKSYLNLDSLQNSLLYANKALILSKTTNSPNKPELISSVLNIMANIMFKQKKIPLAKKYISEAISQLTDYYHSPKRREVAKLYLELAKYNLASGEHIESLHNYQTALNLILSDFNNKNIEQNPNEDNFYPENTIAEALLGKATAFEALYRNDNNIKYLFLSINSYELAFKVWQKLRSTYEYEQSQLYLLSENKTMIENAIILLYEAWKKTGNNYYYQNAFTLCEESKNLLLTEGINKKKALSQLSLPDSITQKGHDINLQIAWNTEQLFNAKNNNKDKSSIEKIEKKLFKLKERKKQFEKEIEKKYPEYYSLIYDKKKITFTKIQQLLQKNQMLVEYFVGEKNIFVFQFTPTKKIL